jgi:hypothetical protein
MDRTDEVHRESAAPPLIAHGENRPERLTACKTLDQDLRAAEEFREICSHQPIAGAEAPSLLAEHAWSA